jgi:hypothetical protein
MGANKTYQQKANHSIIVGESDRIQAATPRRRQGPRGDRERAIRNVCRLYGVNRLDALPSAILAATLALLGHSAV